MKRVGEKRATAAVSTPTKRIDSDHQDEGKPPAREPSSPSPAVVWTRSRLRGMFMVMQIYSSKWC